MCQRDSNPTKEEITTEATSFEYSEKIPEPEAWPLNNNIY